jgi:hypothetical protein
MFGWQGGDSNMAAEEGNGKSAKKRERTRREMGGMGRKLASHEAGGITGEASLTISLLQDVGRRLSEKQELLAARKAEKRAFKAQLGHSDKELEGPAGSRTRYDIYVFALFEGEQREG